MTESKKPSLADLIAKTLGAQSRERAEESIKARRARLLNTAEPPPDFAAPEQLPAIDAPSEFAKAFFERLKGKQTPPAKRFTPRVVVDNATKSPGDDEPEPPKSA